MGRIKTLFSYILTIGVGIFAALRVITKTRSEAMPEHKTTNDTTQGAEVYPQSRPIHREGWIPLEEEELPKATYWPVIMAFSLVFLVWGVITTYIVTFFGLVIFIISVIGWIRDDIEASAIEHAEHARHLEQTEQQGGH